MKHAFRGPELLLRIAQLESKFDSAVALPSSYHKPAVRKMRARFNFAPHKCSKE